MSTTSNPSPIVISLNDRVLARNRHWASDSRRSAPVVGIKVCIPKCKHPIGLHPSEADTLASPDAPDVHEPAPANQPADMQAVVPVLPKHILVKVPPNVPAGGGRPMGPKTQCTSPMHTPPTKTPPKTPPSALLLPPIGEWRSKEPPPMPTPILHPHPFVPKSPPKPHGLGGSPQKLICLGEAMIIAACAAIDATNGSTTHTDAFIEGMKPGLIAPIARGMAP